MDLSGDYDKAALEEQKVFLKDLGPYRKLATKDSKMAFFMCLGKLWFLRWLLKRTRYLDFKGMEFRQGEIFKDVKNRLMWASFASQVTPAHEERGWRGYMKICEARQGIYRENEFDLFDDKQVAEFDQERKRKRAEDEAEGSATATAEDVNTDTATKPRPRPRPHPHTYNLARLELKKARLKWKEPKEAKTSEDI